MDGEDEKLLPDQTQQPGRTSPCPGTSYWLPPPLVCTGNEGGMQMYKKEKIG